MSLDSSPTDTRPIDGFDELLEYFRSGEHPGSTLIGLEHEKFVYPVGGSSPVPYEGARGIGALLEGLEKFGWSLVREAPNLPAIAAQKGNATVSLEPGGQLELSGSPFPSANGAHQENVAHVAELKQVLGPLGLRLVGLGYRPFDTVDSMPWMPKSRYAAMRQTLGAQGKRAHEMMLLTATGQVSLDFGDEKDCGRKVNVAARVSPVLVALYANSPLMKGQPTGSLSVRSQVWDDVDKARCGYQPWMIDGSFSYRAYAEWALDAPILFLRRGGRYQTPKLTFRRFIAEGWEGQKATHDDWVDHLSTMFPEVRVKKLIEVRSADCSTVAMTGALAALMRGLFYDQAAGAQAIAALPKVDFAQHKAFHALAQQQGMEGVFQGAKISELAREVVKAARGGLERLGDDQPALLAPLEAVIAEGKSPARHVLEAPRQPVALLDAFTL